MHQRPYESGTSNSVQRFRKQKMKACAERVAEAKRNQIPGALEQELESSLGAKRSCSGGERKERDKCETVDGERWQQDHPPRL